MALEITDSNFEEVLKKTQITVIDFWAPWCGPCVGLGPIIDQLTSENQDVTIGKINVEDNSKSSVTFGVRAIPTVIFFKNGVVADKIVGMRSKAEFQAKINALK